MISIIIPIYNTEAYLKACLDSVLAQTVQDLQVVLVDDGSTDGSLVIAQTYVHQDARVKLFQQPHAGQSAARNVGLQHAQGQFIAFVDADDTIEPDWCERHLKAIHGVDYVQSGYERNKQHHTPRTIHQYTSPCMRLYRREAIENLRFEEGMIYEDVLWSVDLWISGATCRSIDYTGYHYTVNPHGTTSRPHKEAQRKVLEQLRARRKRASMKGKSIITYTLLRLTLYFIKQ